MGRARIKSPAGTLISDPDAVRYDEIRDHPHMGVRKLSRIPIRWPDAAFNGVGIVWSKAPFMPTSQYP
jgi:hypothetical protein